MLTFDSLVFSFKKIIFSSQSIDLFIKFVNFLLMSSSYLIELIIQIVNVLLVLVLQSVNCLEKLHLCLSLNKENFILKPIYMLLKTVLNCLIIFHKLLISCKNEFNLWIFCWQSFVKITNLIHKAFFNITSQLSYIFDSGFSLVD